MIEWYWALLFFVSLACNGRAALKLLIDWKGMLTTCRLVEEAYEGLAQLPDEAALERDARAPVFVHLVPAFQEPDIAGTLRSLLDSRYPHGKLHVVVAVKEDEERAPHPAMGISTGEVVRRFREELPPLYQKMLSLVDSMFYLEEQQDNYGQDPFCHGLGPANRQNLTTFMRYAREQGYVSREFAIEELFVPATFDL